MHPIQELLIQEESIYELLPNPTFLFKVNIQNQIFLFKVNNVGMSIFGAEIAEFKDQFPVFLNQFSPNLLIDIIKVNNGKDVPSKNIVWNRTIKDSPNSQRTFHFIVDYVKVTDNIVMMTLKDITTIIQQQDAIKASLDLNFGLHAEFSPLGIMILDPAGNIIFANPTTTKLLGWIDGQTTLVEGKNIFTLPIIKNKRKTSDGIEKLLKGQPLVEDELRIESEGGVRVMKLYGSPRFTANDTVEGAILTWAEVTDLIEAQMTLQDQKNELSELASIMRHDLMNYLHNIMGYAEILEQRTHDEYREFSTKIRRNAVQIQKVLTRSYELAEAGKVIEKKEYVDLDKVVEEIGNMTIPNTIHFSKDTLPTLKCDKEKVTQIFQNLFKNATFHANPSFIEVKYLNQEAKEDWILIINDGNLIPVEIQEKVFERGFTTSRGGSGLGLYITKKLCNAHHWKISLEVTDITTFQIRIPKENI